MYSSPEPALARMIVRTPELYGKVKPSLAICDFATAAPQKFASFQLRHREQKETKPTKQLTTEDTENTGEIYRERREKREG